VVNKHFKERFPVFVHRFISNQSRQQFTSVFKLTALNSITHCHISITVYP
jgi:hypothetical protein